MKVKFSRFVGIASQSGRAPLRRGERRVRDAGKVNCGHTTTVGGRVRAGGDVARRVGTHR